MTYRPFFIFRKVLLICILFLSFNKYIQKNNCYACQKEEFEESKYINNLFSQSSCSNQFFSNSNENLTLGSSRLLKYGIKLPRPSYLQIAISSSTLPNPLPRKSIPLKDKVLTSTKPFLKKNSHFSKQKKRNSVDKPLSSLNQQQILKNFEESKKKLPFASSSPVSSSPSFNNQNAYTQLFNENTDQDYFNKDFSKPSKIIDASPSQKQKKPFLKKEINTFRTNNISKKPRSIAENDNEILEKFIKTKERENNTISSTPSPPIPLTKPISFPSLSNLDINGLQTIYTLITEITDKPTKDISNNFQKPFEAFLHTINFNESSKNTQPLTIKIKTYYIYFDKSDCSLDFKDKEACIIEDERTKYRFLINKGVEIFYLREESCKDSKNTLPQKTIQKIMDEYSGLPPFKFLNPSKIRQQYPKEKNILENFYYYLHLHNNKSFIARITERKIVAMDVLDLEQLISFEAFKKFYSDFIHIRKIIL